MRVSLSERRPWPQPLQLDPPWSASAGSCCLTLLLGQRALAPRSDFRSLFLTWSQPIALTESVLDLLAPTPRLGQMSVASGRLNSVISIARLLTRVPVVSSGSLRLFERGSPCSTSMETGWGLCVHGAPLADVHSLMDERSTSTPPISASQDRVPLGVYGHTPPISRA